VPNLPGHGGRPAASVAELAELLARWLDAFALHRPIVVANSLGCQVVTETAIRRPELVGPLVLVGPSVDPARRTARHQIFDALRDSSREPSALVATTVRDAAGANMQWLLSVARSALADRIEDRLPLIPQAAVVVYGDDDPFLSHAWAARAAGLLPCGRLAVVPAEGHAVHFAQPKLVADIVRELDAERQATTAATDESRPGRAQAVGAVIPTG
jgi:pimeloyl-ACP methyl ester carboxylesterase